MLYDLPTSVLLIRLVSTELNFLKSRISSLSKHGGNTIFQVQCKTAFRPTTMCLKGLYTSSYTFEYTCVASQICTGMTSSVSAARTVIKDHN